VLAARINQRHARRQSAIKARSRTQSKPPPVADNHSA
jgi:hypothetical protein